MDYYRDAVVSTQRLRPAIDFAPSDKKKISLIGGIHVDSHETSRIRQIRSIGARRLRRDRGYRSAHAKNQNLLKGLVTIPPCASIPRIGRAPEGHKNLLLYEDRDYNFVVNAVVRTPGRDGRIHDHAHAWTAYGVLDRMEKLERYRRLSSERRANTGAV
jgi:hypothetical protein